MQVMVTRIIEERQLADALVSACEGGSNYWLRELDRLPYAIEADELVLPAIFTEDDEEGTKHTLDAAALARGAQLMAEKYPRQFADEFPAEGGHYNGDAHTSDLFLQLCLLGEQRYC